MLVCVVYERAYKSARLYGLLWRGFLRSRHARQSAYARQRLPSTRITCLRSCGEGERLRSRASPASCAERRMVSRVSADSERPRRRVARVLLSPRAKPCVPSRIRHNRYWLVGVYDFLGSSSAIWSSVRRRVTIAPLVELTEHDAANAAWAGLLRHHGSSRIVRSRVAHNLTGAHNRDGQQPSGQLPDSLTRLTTDR